MNFNTTMCTYWSKFLNSLLCLLLFFIDVNGQAADSAEYKCVYQLEYIKDTIKRNNISLDTQILFIGKNFNEYFSYTNYKSDSTLNEFIDKQKKTGNAVVMNAPSLGFSNIPLPKLDFTYNFFIDKKQQLIKVFDKIVEDKYIYTDSGFIPHWVLADDTSTVMGYKCQRADGYFRGRNYIAWFAKNIPVNSGPYKFYGLPGLILKIYDSQKNFDFECVGIEKLSKKIPIAIETKGYQTISRSKFESLKRLFFEHPFKFMLEANGDANTDKAKALLQFEHPLPYNPIELE